MLDFSLKDTLLLRTWFNKMPEKINRPRWTNRLGFYLRENLKFIVHFLGTKITFTGLEWSWYFRSSIDLMVNRWHWHYFSGITVFLWSICRSGNISHCRVAVKIFSIEMIYTEPACSFPFIISFGLHNSLYFQLYCRKVSCPSVPSYRPAYREPDHFLVPWWQRANSVLCARGSG